MTIMENRINYANELTNAIIDCIGAEAVLDEVLRALSTDQQIGIMEYIANNWEVCADIQTEE